MALTCQQVHAPLHFRAFCMQAAGQFLLYFPFFQISDPSIGPHGGELNGPGKVPTRPRIVPILVPTQNSEQSKNMLTKKRTILETKERNSLMFLKTN